MSFPAGSLAGKRALVTGGAKRIGREIALTLARAGADVAITFRTSEAEAQATVQTIEAAGARGLALSCDLADEAAIERVAAAAVDEFGGLDVLVNNAGAFASAALDEITAAEWDTMFSTNVRAPFLMAKAARAALAAGGGRIVNVGSLGGMRAWATHGHYCASKAALHMLSQTMAKAWAPEIAVNCVAPGMIAIDEADAALAGLAARTPMGRNGTAADVAAAVLFFATCPEFVTGQLMMVDGGLGL